MELDDRYHLIAKNARVVDLGAAPGGWAQVAVKRGAARVVGVDLLPMDPVPGATILEGDFMDDDDARPAWRNCWMRTGRPGPVGHGAEHHRA